MPDRDTTIIVKEHDVEEVSGNVGMINSDTGHTAAQRMISTGSDTSFVVRDGFRKNVFEAFVNYSDSFEIVDSIPSGIIEISDVKPAFGYEGKPIPRSNKTEDGITSLFLVSFILLTSVCGRGLDFIQQMVRNLFEATERDSIFVDNTTVGELRVKAFLLIQSTILTAVFLFVFYSLNHPDIFYEGKDAFIRISLFALALFLFWGIKWLVNTMLGKIFFEYKKVLVWQTGYFSIIELFGILLFPVLLFMVNAQSEFMLNFCIYLIFLMILVGFALIINKGFRVFLRKPYGLFYFILYLCALEFIPYTGLYMGLKYIYKTVELSALWSLR